VESFPVRIKWDPPDSRLMVVWWKKWAWKIKGIRGLLAEKKRISTNHRDLWVHGLPFFFWKSRNSPQLTFFFFWK
jgi:hypothetical protein